MAKLNARGQVEESVPVSTSGASQWVTVEQVCEVMGIPAQDMSPIAWLVLQEESQGVKIEEIAEKLRVDIPDVNNLKEQTTNKTGDESDEIWHKGIIALRTVAIVNQQNIGTGWDAIEALAIDKAARTLSAMRGPGDLEKMVSLAKIANGAIRRARGEATGRGGGGSVGTPNGGMSLELSAGHLGTIRLNLSPAIQQQLSNPARVIDAVANKDVATVGKKVNLEMLSLKDTRQLVGDRAAEEDDKSMTVGGMTFDF